MLVTNIAALQALDPSSVNEEVVAEYYSIQFDGGGGTFYWDDSSIETANNGTIFDTNFSPTPLTGKWKRIYSPPIDIRWFGAKGDGVTYATDRINNAIDWASYTNENTVIISGGTFLIDAGKEVSLNDNTHLIIAAFSKLKKYRVDAGDYTIVGLRNVANVIIDGGGDIVGERDEHTAPGGEHGFGINVAGSTNVVIDNIRISECWGDGIYIGGGTAEVGQPNNILVSRVVCNHNRRQGMSITNADGVKVSNSSFTNTGGTAPEAGIDIEPNANQTVANVMIDNCQCNANEGSGILMFANPENSFIHNISCMNLSTTNNGGKGIDVASNSLGRIKNIDIVNASSVSNNLGGLSFVRVENLNVVNLSIYNSGNSKAYTWSIYLGYISNGNVNNFKIEENSIMTSGLSLLGDNLDVTISNGNISTFNYSITSDNSLSNKNIRILNVKVSQASSWGISLKYTTNSVISGNIIEQCGRDGIRLTDSNNNIISNNEITDVGKDVSNTFAGILIEGTSDNNNIQGNAIRAGLATNKIKYGISCTSTSAAVSNFIINNDLLNSGLTNKINNSGVKNVVIDNRYNVAGSTVNRPTGIPTGFIYSNTDTFIPEIWNGTTWVYNVGTVKSIGSAHTNADGLNLTGTLVDGAITSVIVASGTEYPSASGEVRTFNGYSYERTYSIYKDAFTANLWVQNYNGSAVGQGWVLLTLAVSSTSAPGKIQLATQAEVQAASNGVKAITPSTLNAALDNSYNTINPSSASSISKLDLNTTYPFNAATGIGKTGFRVLYPHLTGGPIIAIKIDNSIAGDWLLFPATLAV
ncbi:MAG: right-handed parallel beta-helix repeat-containing protein [Mucilaginibacter sp.]|jgi:parallel beta-helix repeat protein|uniref:right-handed parallel beta-helix repeat-containing protein n=1 Tax=Mucilaginibacter sp. TaxID=1882438 RepID=UPI00356AA169